MSTGPKLAADFANEAVVWFEEPVSSDDLEGLRLLRDRTPPQIEIAAGEYGYEPFCFRRMLEAGAIDVLQADAIRPLQRWTGQRWCKCIAIVMRLSRRQPSRKCLIAWASATRSSPPAAAAWRGRSVRERQVRCFSRSR
jgi:hypothetical protein